MDQHFTENAFEDLQESPAGSRKTKLKKKETVTLTTAEEPDPQGSFIYCIMNYFPLNVHFDDLSFVLSDFIGKFCESMDDFCGRAESASCDQDMGTGGVYLSLNDMKLILNEINAIRDKKLLHLVPLDALTRLLNILDYQIQCGQGLSLDEMENVSLF